jgi:hypothetical protein
MAGRKALSSDDETSPPAKSKEEVRSLFTAFPVMPDAFLVPTATGMVPREATMPKPEARKGSMAANDRTDNEQRATITSPTPTDASPPRRSTTSNPIVHSPQRPATTGARARRGQQSATREAVPTSPTSGSSTMALAKIENAAALKPAPPIVFADAALNAKAAQVAQQAHQSEMELRQLVRQTQANVLLGRTAHVSAEQPAPTTTSKPHVKPAHGKTSDAVKHSAAASSLPRDLVVVAPRRLSSAPPKRTHGTVTLDSDGGASPMAPRDAVHSPPDLHRPFSAAVTSKVHPLLQPVSKATRPHAGDTNASRPNTASTRSQPRTLPS